MVQVGHTGARRLPLLEQLICAEQATCSDQQFKSEVLEQASERLGAVEVLVHDAGASIDMQSARSHAMSCGWIVTAPPGAISCPTRSVARAARRIWQPGAPVARTYKKHRSPATSPDVTSQFEHDGRTIHVRGWQNVVRRAQKVAPDQRDLHDLGLR